MSPSSSSLAPSPAKYRPSNREKYVSRKRCGSPKTPRSMPGHGWEMVR
jgi:hypothetical protein